MSEALPLSEASLLAVRPALNAPVLNVGFVPVGPARAAIVVFAEEWGGIGFALGIRSNEGGQVVVFRNQESIEPEVPISDVLEPVLAEAERMGFLFDEDMLDTKPAGLSRELAMALWGRLMGEIDLPPAPRAVRAEPATTESIFDRSDGPASFLTEFVLHEVAEGEHPEISLDLEDKTAALPAPRESVAPAAAPAPPPPAPAKALLSKFRHLNELSTTTSKTEIDRVATPNSGSKLGQIPIVQIRRERDRNKRIPYLARLLSSF